MHSTGRSMFLIAVTAWLVVAGPAVAAPEDTKEKDPVFHTLDARVAQFLEGISLGQAQSAFNELLAGSQLLKQVDAVKDLVARTNDLEAKYGKYRAFEQVSAKRVGADLVLMRYLYKCDNYPVVWFFAFYRTPGLGENAGKAGPWRIVAVRFDTDLEPL